jgi:rubrerythrin
MLGDLILVLIYTATFLAFVKLGQLLYKNKVFENISLFSKIDIVKPEDLPKLPKKIKQCETGNHDFDIQGYRTYVCKKCGYTIQL